MILQELKDISFEKEHWKKEKTIDTLRSHVSKKGTPALLNTLLFFEELGEDLSVLKTCFMPQEVSKIIGKYIHPKTCHINASVVAHFNEIFLFYYGFCDFTIMDYNKVHYLGTELHSFNVCTQEDQRIIFDPTISKLNLKTKEEIYHRGRNYFGVNIPYEIIDEIIDSHSDEKKGIANVSAYMKGNIFPFEEATLEFIKRIKQLRVV